MLCKYEAASQEAQDVTRAIEAQQAGRLDQRTWTSRTSRRGTLVHYNDLNKVTRVTQDQYSHMLRSNSDGVKRPGSVSEAEATTGADQRLPKEISFNASHRISFSIGCTGPSFTKVKETMPSHNSLQQ